MAAAASLASLPSSLLFKRSLSLTPFRTLPRLTCSLSSSLEFNITFAPKPKPASKPDPDSLADSGQQLFIPWIVRGDDGKLKLQSHPPARLLHEMAKADTKTKANKKKKDTAAKQRVPAAEPKHSKAARRFYNENFRESQRLSKVLAAAGVASRRSSEQLIFDGKVTVNGSVCNTPQTPVDPGRDIIYVNGRRLPKKLPPKVYLALNKPKGYICAAGENKSVLGLFDDYLKSWDKRNPGTPRPRLFTVGRLDVATTGLIVVTNDGDFAQSISHPSANLTKEYIAVIEGSVSKRNLIAISEGTVIDGVHCTPDSVELLPQQPEMSRSRLRIVVHEGRNHEVRELVKKAGLEIHSLKRVRIGGFRLPTNLGLGTHMELRQGDLSALGWKTKKVAVTAGR
ncbi:putative ribosomal large subunit pseudouridine synthase SVR1, chloroplastic [Rosa sericea]